MKRLPQRFAWLIVFLAVTLAAALKIWTDVGGWVWVLVVVAFLGIGAALGDQDGDSDGDSDADSGDDGGSSSDGGGDGGGGD